MSGAVDDVGGLLDQTYEPGLGEWIFRSSRQSHPYHSTGRPTALSCAAAGL